MINAPDMNPGAAFTVLHPSACPPSLPEKLAGLSPNGDYAMRLTTSSKHEQKNLLRRRLALLASVATVAVAILLAGPGRFLQLSEMPMVTPAHAVETAAGPPGFADVVQKVKPAVISVRVKIKGRGPSVGSTDNDEDQNQLPFPKGSPFERFFRDFGMPNLPMGRGMQQFTLAQGSGFFISADGYAVTNNHVVDNAQSVEIATDDGKTYTAKVVGKDAKTDVALIKIDGRGGFPYVKFAETEPRVGDWVVAVGNPYGLGGTVTAGIISARGRDIGSGPYDDFIQIDAPVNKGNSGGSRDLAKKIAAVKPGTTVHLGILHDGSQKTIALTVTKMANETLAQNGRALTSSRRCP
jgi:serine protease Do